MNQTKKDLRKKMKFVLREFCKDGCSREKLSLSAAENFLCSNIYTSATAVCIFCAMPDEIDTTPLITHALQDGKKVALPLVDLQNGGMDFYFLDNAKAFSEQIVCGAYDIFEPKATGKNRLLDVNNFFLGGQKNHTVFIVPGLAFDKAGVRLGKGKGFYDKYFSRLPYKSIATSTNDVPSISISLVAFCFDFQITESVPCETHDFCMTHLATPTSFSQVC